MYFTYIPTPPPCLLFLDCPTNLYHRTENSFMFCLVNHVYRGGLGNKDPKNPKENCCVFHPASQHGFRAKQSTVNNQQSTINSQQSTYRSNSFSSLVINSDDLAAMAKRIAYNKTFIFFGATFSLTFFGTNFSYVLFYTFRANQSHISLHDHINSASL